MGRLIDIDVLFDYFGNDAIDETTRSNIEYFVSEKGTVEAIPIPKGATNGDMIRALYPECEVYGEEDIDDCVSVENLDSSIGTRLFKDWWNAPYKENEDGNNDNTNE